MIKGYYVEEDALILKDTRGERKVRLEGDIAEVVFSGKLSLATVCTWDKKEDTVFVVNDEGEVVYRTKTTADFKIEGVKIDDEKGMVLEASAKENGKWVKGLYAYVAGEGFVKK